MDSSVSQCIYLRQKASRVLQLMAKIFCYFHRTASIACNAVQLRESCLSVCQTRGLWQNGKKDLPIFERSLTLFLLEEEWLVVGNPFYLKFWVKLTTLERNRRFLADIAPGAWAVTRVKRSINTSRKFTTRFPVSLRRTSYVAHKSPKGGWKRKVSKIWTISCDISETVRDRP